MNKVILNQARQQHLLEDIFKQLKPNEISTTLKSDESFSRKLVNIYD